jgi:succinyl-diaminopimelate desuccinylase
METIDLAKELISYDTTSPVTEPDVFVYLQEVLADCGVTAELHNHNGVYNLTAEIGKDGASICFNGHVDAVPAGHGWTVTDPFTPRVSDGKLYGRGAADMKCALAAEITAFMDLAQDPEFDGSATLMVVGDEEQGGENGTAALLENADGYDYAIIGEPTDMNIQIGARGLYWADIYLTGKSVHAARPAVGDNPVDRLPQVLDALDDLGFTREQDPRLPEPTAPVTVVETDGPQNSIPGQVRIGLDIRNLPGQTQDEIRTDIRRALDPVGVGYELEMTKHGEAFMLPDDHFKTIATETVEAVTGNRPQHITEGGQSDGRFFVERGTPFIEIGPDQKPGHQSDEWCMVEQPGQLRATYREVAKRLADHDGQDGRVTAMQ